MMQNHLNACAVLYFQKNVFSADKFIVDEHLVLRLKDLLGPVTRVEKKKKKKKKKK